MLFKINKTIHKCNHCFIHFMFLYPSIHASSFDLVESRPVSGVRLSPLDYVSTLDVTLCNVDMENI